MPRDPLRAVCGECRRTTFCWLQWALMFFFVATASCGDLETALGQTPAGSSIDYQQAIARLEAAVRYEVASKGLPAFSIALVDGERVVWADGFGYQDAEESIPATADTVYRVGSVSKLFTDVAVMQLVEQGRLELDKPVADYLEGFRPENPFGEAQTLGHMMSHQAGLVRESPVGNYFDPSEPSLAATVASLNDTVLVYEPGTKVKYSNAALAVVGAVLEKVLDRSHPAYVQEYLLEPLGMRTSGFEITDAMAPRLAQGWMRTYDGRRFAAPTFLLGTGPAGNMYASMLDLSKFLSCLFRDGRVGQEQLLSHESLEQMTSPVVGKDGEPRRFGLGFHIQELDGMPKIGHGGAVYGFSTQLEALPQRKLGVAASASLDGANGVVSRIVDYSLRLMVATQDGQALPAYGQTVPVPAERAAALVGRYRQTEGDSIAQVSELNGKVFAQFGTFRHELRADADSGELLIDDEIRFLNSVELAGDTLRVGEQSYQRQPSNAPEDAPARWRGLIGEYGWDHNTLYILEDQGQLVALIEWFYYYPLTEISSDEFAFPDYGLYHGERLFFQREAAGVASAVKAAEVVFQRRNVGTADGETFKIEPVQPIDDLRASALAAEPPNEPGDFRQSELVELVDLDSSIKLDVRYASTNNFMGAVFYQQPRAFLQAPAAAAVVRAHRALRDKGLGLLIHDAYRPWHVTKMFWDATPGDLKDFVANPALGSRHNRGCAVDLTLYDLTTGEPIQMVAGYDEFSPRAYPQYPGGTARQRWYRDLLRKTMEAEGFQVYEFEWWHFDYQDWKQYRIGNATFEGLSE